MNDLLFQSVSRIKDALTNRKISCQELVQISLDRIADVNPKLNAVVQINEQCLDEATKVDSEIQSGIPGGPLQGIPMTIKDSFCTKGITTTAGSAGLKDFVPDQDATVVQRLKQAGAILLGKTNTPEITLRFKTDNFVYGQTNNPYNTKRIPGGSSGGAVAIIAAGGSPFDIGTDTGGSIRTPAHFCGISGLKPTRGQVPRTGHMPFNQISAVEALTQAGPLARYVSDLELLLPIISGPDWIDASVTGSPPHPNSVDLKNLRVAFFIDNGITSPDSDTVGIMERVVSALEKNCRSVVEDKLPNLAGSADLWRQIIISDGGLSVENYLKELGTTTMHPFLNWTQEGTDIAASEYMRILTHWNQFQSECLSFMGGYDLLLCPVAPHAAPAHDFEDPFNYCFVFNLLGWPVVVVRCGTSSDGLPIGVQIIARPWREDVALEVGKFIEREFEGYQKPAL